VLAKDLGSRGITVNTISPGPVDTPQFREGKPQSVLDSIAKQNPSRRLGEPDDIAPIVAFLGSQAAQWITGQNIRVNGVSCRSRFICCVAALIVLLSFIGFCCLSMS
jgi:3-oxoacyl-[acyl-carrier protein] reductase